MSRDTERRPRTTTPVDTEFSFSSGTLYSDKDELITKNLVFTITKIVFEKNAGYEPGSHRWVIQISFGDNRPDEIITMQSNEGRTSERSSRCRKAHCKARPDSQRAARQVWKSLLLQKRNRNQGLIIALTTEGRRLQSTGPQGF